MSSYSRKWHARNIQQAADVAEDSMRGAVRTALLHEIAVLEDPDASGDHIAQAGEAVKKARKAFTRTGWCRASAWHVADRVLKEGDHDE